MTVLAPAWLGWIAGTTALHWLLPERLRDWFLAAAAAAFLALAAPLSLLLLAALAATIALAAAEGAGGRALAVGGAIALLLAAFKLFAAGATDDPQSVLLPLGLSYTCFRCLHYVIERYKGTLPPHGPAEVVGYLFFLPTMLAGPIHRFGDYLKDRRRRRWDGALLSQGLERILYGYVKIVVLANVLVSDRLMALVGRLEADGEAAAAAWLGMIAKGLNGYLQFAGYSDIAIGFALLLGFRVMENFNWPFLARNIADFWQRWHISLSSWCRDYVYMVVVAVTRRPALAAVAAMVVLGLWHEISPRYLAWGLYNAAGILLWQRFQEAKPLIPAALRPPPAVAEGLSILLTFHFVMIGFVIVQEPSLEDTWRVWRTMAGG